jgi:uncharacterized protein (DUF1697 family)
MTRYALLLRGINLGRARRVAMADLRALLAAEGFTGVATLLQSGNVVLDADVPADALARSVEAAITAHLGLAVEVVVRSREQVRAVLARDPLGDVAVDGARYVVAFLAEPAGAALEDMLAAVEPGDDRYVVDATELYVWCPDGQLHSPVMAALGKLKGGPVTTVRNWNTVQKLGALLER